MIRPEQVTEIKRLLRVGLTQRATARAMGISKTAVGEIAKGIDRPRLRMESKKRERRPFGKEIARCRECGGMVYMPCYACRIRNS